MYTTTSLALSILAYGSPDTGMVTDGSRHSGGGSDHHSGEGSAHNDSSGVQADVDHHHDGSTSALWRVRLLDFDPTTGALVNDAPSFSYSVE